MPASKTTVRRDGSESSFSWMYQGSAQAEVARGHRKPCRVVLLEYCKGFSSTNAFGKRDIQQRDGHQKSRGSGGIFQRDRYTPPDGKHLGYVDEKCASVYTAQKVRRIPPQRYSIERRLANSHLRSDEVPHVPDERYDYEPRTFHDTHRICIIGGPASQGEMGHHRWHHER